MKNPLFLKHFFHNVSKNKFLLLTLLLLCFHIIINIIILNIDNTPFAYDYGTQRTFSLDYFESIKTLNFPRFFSIYNEIYLYPPLFVLSSTPLYFIFGTSQDISSLTNVIFMVILYLSLFYFVKKIENEKLAFLSVFFVSLIPIVYGMSRVYMVDFALISMVMLSITLMIYTNRFSRPGITFLFGISLGLGIFTKWSFALYMIGPFAYYIIDSFNLSFKSPFITNPKKSIPLIVSLIISLLLNLSWYYNKIVYILFTIRFAVINEVGVENYSPLLLKNFFSYISILNQDSNGFFIALFFGFVISLFFMRKKDYIIPVLGIAIPFITLSLNSSKDIRYIMPILPFFTIVSIKGFSIIFKKISKFNLFLRTCLNFSLVTIMVLLLSGFLVSNFDQSKRDYELYDGLTSIGMNDSNFDNIYNTIENLTNGHNESSLLMIPNFYFTDALGQRIRGNKLPIIIDQGLLNMCNVGMPNRKNNLSEYIDKEFICKKDIVITFEEKFDYELYGLFSLQKESPIYLEIVLPFIRNWEICKNNFYLVEKYKDNYAYGRNVTLLLYKNKNY